MNYEEFKQELQEKLQERAGSRYVIRICKEITEANVPGDVVIRRDSMDGDMYKAEISPIYQIHSKLGVPVDRIAEIMDILFHYLSQHDGGIETSRIFYRLENLEHVIKEYPDAAYQRFLDLAIVFYVNISNSENSIQSLRITNQMLKASQLSMSDLLRFANQNTPKMLPATICTLDDAIFKMAAENAHLLDDPEIYMGLTQLFLMSIGLIPDSDSTKRYVLRCEGDRYGSTAILYPNLLKDIGEKVRSDFYLMPTSKHEAAVEVIGEKDRLHELIEEAQDLTKNIIDPKDSLSTHVYRYSREDGSLKIVG